MKRYGFVLALLAAGIATPAAADRLDLGTAFAMASSYCPEGSLPADGRELKVHDNEPLFSLFGKRYGGDGATSFALPDLRAGISGAGPSNGPPLTWCIVTQGSYPDQPH